jgi:hypothetical protein
LYFFKRMKERRFLNGEQVETCSKVFLKSESVVTL